MSLGDIYVIRIYRRGAARTDAAAPRRRATDRIELAGLIEDPVSGASRAFRETSELLALLCEPPRRATPLDRRRKGKR
jgi:hypothetical protein